MDNQNYQTTHFGQATHGNGQKIGLTNSELALAFDSFGQEDRKVIIPFGFPNSGKSHFLASLIHYMSSGPNINWSTNVLSQPPFHRGRIAYDEMCRHYTNKKIYPRTQKDSIDIIGIDLFPSYRNNPPQKFAFVDLPGEDLENVKFTEGHNFPPYIKSVLDGLTYGKVIFVLISPFSSTSEYSHSSEDELMFDFVNYLQTTMPLVFARSKFMLVISKWDLNPNKQNEDVEGFIRSYRPRLYSKMRQIETAYGPYSVGHILNTTDYDNDGNLITLSQLTQVNSMFPHRIIKAIYNLCTGKNIDKTSFFG